MSDFEKLGTFYLGRPYDLANKTAKPGLLLYDSKDLVTHAVCVGMTGSGKTGLCIGLLEEAAIDNIPAIIIDPKGDIANLLLTFPELRGSDFLPWINPDDAKKKELTPEAFAEKEAAKWKAGLESWGQDGARISRLREAADFLDLYPWKHRRFTGLHPAIIFRTFSKNPGRHRTPRGACEHHGHELAQSDWRGCRSLAKPGTYFVSQYFEGLLGGKPRFDAVFLDSIHSISAIFKTRRDGPGIGVFFERSICAGDAV